MSIWFKGSKKVNSIIILISFTITGILFIYTAYMIPMLSSFYYVGGAFIILGIVWVLYVALSERTKAKNID